MKETSKATIRRLKDKSIDWNNISISLVNWYI